MYFHMLSDPTYLHDGRVARPAGTARQHLDATVRGLVFVAALLAPFALTFAPAAFGHAASAGLETRPRALPAVSTSPEDCLDEDCLEDSLGEDWIDFQLPERR